MKRIFAIILVLCAFGMVFSGCGKNKDEEKVLAVVQKYIKATEENDDVALCECFDPSLQKAADSIVDSIGGAFGINGASDIVKGFGGFTKDFKSALKNGIGLGYEININKIVSCELDETKGDVTIDCTMKLKMDGKSYDIPFTQAFEVSKNNNNWYIYKEGEMVLDEEAVINQFMPK